MYLDVKDTSKGKVYVADVGHSHHPIQENGPVSDEVIEKITYLSWIDV